jgi:cobalt/nickel transport system permease protein
MHIGDGMLAPRVFLPLAGVAAIAVGAAVAIANRRLTEERHVPLLGVSGAFVFASQMLNFPVLGGTSGHFLGAALTAILLGPASAVIVFTAVLILQCFLFGDGGAYALGANIVNMGVIGGVVGSFVNRAVIRAIGEPNRTARRLGAFAGAWLSIVVSAAACSAELRSSRRAASSRSWSARTR